MKHIILAEKILVTINDRDSEGNAIQREVHIDPLYFYRYLIDSDREFNADSAGMRSSIRLDAAMKKVEKESLKILSCEDEDHKRLDRACKSPSNGYPIIPARRLEPFITSVSDAKDKEPENE